MKMLAVRILFLPFFIAALFLNSCATVNPGSDPVVVNAERDTAVAIDVFDAVEKADLNSYAAWKAIDPKSAAAFRTYVNYLRAHEVEWLKSARTLTKAYKYNRTPENKANLATAMATLQSATAEANKYLSQIATAAPKAWVVNPNLIWGWLTKHAVR